MSFLLRGCRRHAAWLDRVLAGSLCLASMGTLTSEANAQALPQGFARIDVPVGMSAPAMVTFQSPALGLTISGATLGRYPLRHHPSAQNPQGAPLLQAQGVLMATARGANFQAMLGVPGELSDPQNAPAGVHVSTALGTMPQDVPCALGVFPFAAGWAGGHFDSLGTVLSAGNLPPTTSLLRVGLGRYRLRVPGIRAATDGLLFVVGATDPPHRVAATPEASGGWDIAVRTAGQLESEGTDGPVSFLFVPFGSEGLVAGRVVGGVGIAASGGFTVTEFAPGVFHVRVPGVTSDVSGVALVAPGTRITPFGPAARALTVDFDPGLLAFVVRAWDVASGNPTSSDFGFAFLPFFAQVSPRSRAWLEVPSGWASVQVTPPGFALATQALVTRRSAGFELGFPTSLPGRLLLGLDAGTGLAEGRPLLQGEGVTVAMVSAHDPAPAPRVPGELTSPSVLNANGGSWIVSGTAQEFWNVDLGIAHFPFAAGWAGAHVDAAGSAVGGGNLPAGWSVTRWGLGRYRLSLPGVAPSSDGVVLVSGADATVAHRLTAAPSATGWELASRRVDQDLNDGVDAPFGFVFVPYAARALHAGRIDADGTVLESTGNFTVQRTGLGTYAISVPGALGAVDALVVAQPCGLVQGLPADVHASGGFGAGNGLLVRTYDMPTGQPTDAQFYLLVSLYASPPCLVENLQLHISERLNGNGIYSIEVRNGGGTPGSQYFTCLTVNQGNYPFGYWFGIEPPFPELLAEATLPFAPFNGFFDPCGASVFSLYSLQQVGVPFFGVTVEIGPAGQFVRASAPMCANL